MELKTAFAGLTESGLTVEVVGTGNTVRVTARHPDYRGELDGRGVLFMGIHGSAGNMGGPRLKGGRGFEGGSGVLVRVAGG